MTRDPSFVRVALPLPLDRTFTYSVPGGTVPAAGTRVLVPFRREQRIGWVVGPTDGEGIDGIRPVLSVLDQEPTVPKELVVLARWVSDYYLTSLGIALRSIVPAVLCDVSRHRLMRIGDPPSGLRGREELLVQALDTHGGSAAVRTLRRALGMGSIWPEIRSLEALGVVSLTLTPPKLPAIKIRKIVTMERWISSLQELDEMFARAPRQREAYDRLAAMGGSAELSGLLGAHGFSRAVIGGLEEKGVARVEALEVLRDPFVGEQPPPPVPMTPTDAQAAAIRALVSALDAGKPKPFLLRGVTGSGKTLVYIELLRAVLERGKSGIVLVPEIALTPQTVSRFRTHFGSQIAVLHSGLSDGERYDAWRQLKEGHRRIAVGARSALFAPLSNLGAIVVDEEHDGSYKQGETPRYQGRDLAVVRASLAGAVCVLGSATPSLESWANAQSGKFDLLTLPHRVGGASLPTIKVIDLREVKKAVRSSDRPTATSEGATVLSPQLFDAMTTRLERREQTILLLNRRGYSSFIQCRDCGDVASCLRCSVSLTYHRAQGRLLCHHCRHEEPALTRCPRCGSTDLSRRGLGTEQVERVVAETFPQARLARMDVDTTSGKWSHREILGRVERGEVDVLLGTQMIAKGLDFPRVTLVGVVNADVGLHLPDFRASERTFQLLSQVAGRAGRGALGGEVFIQTSVPDHYAVKAAVAHDYETFASRELQGRVDPVYPPYVRLINVIVSSPVQEIAAREAESAARWVEREAIEGAKVVVVGPAPSPIERLHGRWRWHFLLRGKRPSELGGAARRFVDGFRPRGRDVRIILDRDPTALM
ncbi:MAG: primosomal protein N' [Gemmatimonadota bacterium]|nr:MAG: primosomal protein N' [Gemmatimonadota bacterium]